MLASEALRGNITHLKNGREPNAGACILPTIPCVPLFFCLIAWGLDRFFEQHAILIMISVFAALYTLWTVGYMKLKSEFETLSEEANKSIEEQPIQPPRD